MSFALMFQVNPNHRIEAKYMAWEPATNKKTEDSL